MSTTSNPSVPISPVGGSEDGARRRDALQTLLTRLVDARDGLDAMIERAEPEITPILRKIREDHHESSIRVSAMIVAEGGEPDADGSMQSTVNKAVVSIRAIFDDLDEDALERVVEGEQHVIDAFEDAAAEHENGRARDELAEMRQRLGSLLDEADRMAT